MTYTNNKKANIFYGKIDFYSMKGEVMETTYYESKEEFYKEMEDSYEIGRPINPKILSYDEKQQNDFEEEDEEMEME